MTDPLPTAIVRVPPPRDPCAGVSSLNAAITQADGRPKEALFDKRGHRLIVKLKTKDF